MFIWLLVEGSNKDLVESLLLKLKVYNNIFEAVNSFPDPNIKAIEWFLDNGDDINCKDKSKQTMLHFATRRYGNPALFNMCLQRGIDIDSQDFRGCTALHDAIYFVEKQFIKLLMQHNACLNIKNWENKTPLDLAQSEGYENMLKIINSELENQKQKKENSHFPDAFKRLITQELLQRHPFVLDANTAAASGNDFMLANAFVLQRDKKAHCADRAFTVSSKPIEPLQPLD